MGSARINAIRQRLSATGLPDDFGKKRKGPKDKKFDKLVDKITDTVMKGEKKKDQIDPRRGNPEAMRRDITTPLIKEVPFGSQKYPLKPPAFGDPKAYDHIDSNLLNFDEREEKAKEMGFPTFEEQHGVPEELQDKSKAFHVIPHGGISIPKEQNRNILPFEKRKWETNKRLITRSNMQDKRRQDALDVMNDIIHDEKESRLVRPKRKYGEVKKSVSIKGRRGNKLTSTYTDHITNREKRKIRPPKPVRSDFAEIITAKQRTGIVRKPAPDAFKLPNYTELDYEAWHDKVHDTEWRLEDAYDSGIFPEDHDWDSLDHQMVNRPWKQRSEYERQKLRPHYQKMMSSELPWQKDPTHYTSGKIPPEKHTYFKPGFSSHITTDARVPTDPDAYYNVHPKDILNKDTNVSQMDLDNPDKYGKQKRYGKVGVSLGQGYWESLNTAQRDNLLIRAGVRSNKPSDQILFDGLPKPFQNIINRRATNVTLNPKIDKEQELTTRKKVYGDFKDKSKSARIEALRQRMAYDPPEEDILGSSALESADAFEIHKQPHNIPPSRLIKKKIHAKDKTGAAFENFLGGDDVNQITGEEYKSQLDEIIRKGFIGENVDRTKKYKLDRTNKMPYQRTKDVAQGWTRDYIQKHKLAKQRLGIKYFNEGQNIIQRADARATFLTPEGNYIGKRSKGLFSESDISSYSHSQYIEDIKDPNPSNYPNMGDYTDNPRVLDYMDREDMVRINSNSSGTDVEVLNEPDQKQIKAIRKIFQEDVEGFVDVSVWGMGEDGIFQKTNVTSYKDFRKTLRTNEWKNNLDPNMQSQIKEHWLTMPDDMAYRGDTDLHVNRLGRDAKSSRIQTARERLGGLTDHDVEISHEGPVTRRKADKPVKKFYEKKHKTYGEDRIKKIREEAELEGMFETGDKRIPLQKVDKPFHSKKPFLRSFTPENAKKLAKRKRNV